MRRLILCLCLCFAAPALAQDDEASRASKEHYQKGKTAYDLGRFDEAVKEFEKAYELKPDPAYIFNLAQTYKQKGDHQKAVFYYRRYLTLSPQAKNREAIESRIAELETLLKNQADQKEKPPDGLNPPGGPDGRQPDGQLPPGGVPDEPEDPKVGVTVQRPSVVRISAAAGPVFLGMGNIDVPAQLSVFLQAGYTLHLSALDLDFGAGFGLTPVPWGAPEAGTTGTSLMLSGVGLVGAKVNVHPRVGLRAEIGGGVLSMNGLDATNPFTDGGTASKALTMLTLRGSVGVDIHVVSGFLVTVMPVAFSFSPAPEVMVDSVKRVTRFELLVGVGYAL